MKKFYEIVKPFLSIIFGALLFLCYFNLLNGQGEVLAIGIIAVIFAAFYLCIGILGIVLGEKFASARKVLDPIGITLFPLFMYVYWLLTIISFAKIPLNEPAGWTIAVISMVASISLATMILISTFINNAMLKRLSNLFASIFILSLLLNLTFDLAGNPETLGKISVPVFAMYVTFSAMLLSSLSAPAPEIPKAEAEPEAKEEAPAEEPSEAPAQEETPSEEKPAEEEPKEE